MALLYLEGFEGFGTTTGTAGTTNVQNGLGYKYTGVFNQANGVRIYSGWGAGYGLAWASNSFGTSNYVDFALSSLASVYIGFALKTNSPVATNVLVAFRNNADSKIHMRLDLVAGGGLRIGRANLTTLMNSVMGVIPQGRWCYIESYVLINDTTGAYTVKVNGTTVMSATNVDTRDAGTTATLDSLRLIGHPASADTADANVMIDDLYILDSTGSAPNNTFLGPIKIEGILPDAAGDSAAFTPSAGSNYQCVDENPENSDTDYVSSGTSGHIDLYNFGSLATVNGTIYGAQVNLVDKLDAAGSLNVRAKAKHSSTTGNGSTVSVTSTTYGGLKHIFELNPSTSAAWTASEINAAQFGVEVV